MELVITYTVYLIRLLTSFFFKVEMSLLQHPVLSQF
jgi:hypothetical protein